MERIRNISKRTVSALFMAVMLAFFVPLLPSMGTTASAVGGWTHEPLPMPGLVYDGTPLPLTGSGGLLEFYTGYYRVNNGAWQTTRPTATNAGTYTVDYHTKNFQGNIRGEGSLTATIAKASSSITVDAAAKPGLVYNGGSQNLLNTLPQGKCDPTGETGTIEYSVNNGGWTTAQPTGTNAGTYTIRYRVKEATNWNASSINTITAVIQKASARVTAPTVRNNLTYNGSAQALVTAGTTSGGTLQYSLNNSTWQNTVPTGTNAGTYTVYYRLSGGTNYNDVAASSFSVTIAKANSSYRTRPTARTGLTANGSPQALANAGSATGGTLQYSLDNANWTTAVPTATVGGTYTVYYRVAETANYNGIAAASFSVTVGAGSSSMAISPVSATYGDTNVMLTVTVSNASKNGISLFTAQNVVDFYIADTGAYLGNSQVQYTDNGTVGTAMLTITNIDQRFEPGVNNIKAIYGGGPTLLAEEVTSGALTVIQRTVTLTWEGHATRDWTGAPSHVTATAGNIIKGDGRVTDTVNVDIAGGTESDAGDHTAVPSLSGAHAKYYKLPDNPEIVYTINKVAPEFVTEPIASTGLVFNSTAQELVIAGSAIGGVVEYKLGDGDWSVNVPSSAESDTYTVYYRIKGDNNHTDLEDNSRYVLTVRIEAGDKSIITAPSIQRLVYDGTEKALVTEGEAAESFTLKYRLGDTGEYSTAVPTQANAGTYHVYYMAEADSGNAEDNFVPEGYLTVVIEKADSVITGAETTFKYGEKFSLDNITLSTPGKDPSGATEEIESRDRIIFTILKDGEEVALTNDYMLYTNTAKTEGKISIPQTQMNKQNCVVGRNTIIARYAGNANVKGCESYIYFNINPIEAQLDWSGTATRTYDGTDSNVTARVINYLAADRDHIEVVVTNGAQSAAGTHTAIASGLTGISAAYYSIPEANTTTYTIDKANSKVTTAPETLEVVYDGGQQQLVSAGEAENGIMQYSLDNTDDNWLSTVPMATDAGDYTVYYKVKGNTNYNDTAVQSVNAHIEKADPIVTAPIANSIIYDGSAQELVKAAETNGGTIEYKLDNGEWTTEVPTATDAGDYTVSYRIVGNSNFNDAAEASVAAKIDMADITSSAVNDEVTYGDTFDLTVRLTNRQSGISLFTNPDNVDLVLDNGGIQRTIGSAPVQYDDSSKIEGTVKLTNVRVTSDFQPGINTIYVKYGGNVNVNGNDTNTVQLNVKPRVLSLDWSGYDTRVYEPGTSNNVRAAVGNIFNNDNVGVVITGGDESDAGEYTAVAELTGNMKEYYALPENFEQEYIIEKADSVLTLEPTPIENLAYTGEPQALVTAGEAENGTVVYKINDGEWSSEIPAVVDAGDYTISYKSQGDKNYNDTEEQTFEEVISIAKIDPTVTAPEANTLAYTGEEQELVTAGVTNGGTIMYKLDEGDWSTEIPTAAEVGNYTVYYRVDEDNNFNAAEEASINVRIDKADTIVTSDAINVQYNDSFIINAKVEIAPSDLSLYVSRDTIEFHLGDEMGPTVATASVDYNETGTEGSASVRIKASKLVQGQEGFVPGENTIIAVYGGSVSLNDSYENKIVVNVTPIELGLEWTGTDTRTYDGQGSNVSAALTGDIIKGDDVSVTVQNGDAVNAGDHTAVAVLTGDDAGYYALPENASAEYVIEKADPQVEVPTNVNAIVGMTLLGVTLPEGWSWTDDTQKVEVIGENTFTAIYTPEDTVNYNVLSNVEITVTGLAGTDYTITDIRDAEEEGFVNVEVRKNTVNNGVLFVASYTKDNVLTAVKCVDIQGITGADAETENVKIELNTAEGGHISAFVWGALNNLIPLSNKFIK